MKRFDLTLQRFPMPLGCGLNVEGDDGLSAEGRSVSEHEACCVGLGETEPIHQRGSFVTKRRPRGAIGIEQGGLDDGGEVGGAQAEMPILSWSFWKSVMRSWPLLRFWTKVSVPRT